jgi:hypothetical protein
MTTSVMSFGPPVCPVSCGGVVEVGAVGVVLWVGGQKPESGGSGVVGHCWSWELFDKVVPLCFFGSTHYQQVRAQPQAI